MCCGNVVHKSQHVADAFEDFTERNNEAGFAVMIELRLASRFNPVVRLCDLTACFREVLALVRVSLALVRT